MRTFEDTFAVNETKVYPSGNYLKLITAVAGVDVEYFRRATAFEKALSVTSGYGVRYDQRFTSVRVTSATAQTVKLGISEGQGELDKTSTDITGGTLDGITDRKSMDGAHFISQVRQQGLASNISYIQLLNPLASGVSLAVRRIACLIEVTDRVLLSLHETQIAGASARPIGNKAVNDAAGKATVFRKVDVAVSFGTIYTDQSKILADTWIELLKKDPIIVPADEGLLVNPVNFATGLNVIFEWEEYAP